MSRGDGTKLALAAASPVQTANTYSRLALGIGIHDITAGYRAYRREALEAIDLDGVDSRATASRSISPGAR